MDNDRPQFVYVTYINADADRVWQALTDGDFTSRYWGGLRITSTWQPGAEVTHVSPDGRVALAGEVLQADRPHCLSYTFHMQISEETRAEPPSRITFQLQAIETVTVLTVTHEHTSRGATFNNTSNGWPALMSSLKSLLETGQPLPFTRLGFGPDRKTL